MSNKPRLIKRQNAACVAIAADLVWARSETEYRTRILCVTNCRALLQTKSIFETKEPNSRTYRQIGKIIISSELALIFLSEQGGWFSIFSTPPTFSR
ncbi:TPA: hypothetical protein RH317_004787 [Escherichia coli]|nr:hypothetical protein [Escherichia coli]